MAYYVRMHADFPVAPPGTAPDGRAGTAIARLAAAVSTALSERYGVPVMRTGPHLVRVLPGAPLALALECAAHEGVDRALVAPIDTDALEWLSVPDAGVDLWRNHGAHDELVTQTVAGDPPFQVVADHDGWQLLRLADGATGWAEARDHAPAEQPAACGTASEIDAARFAAEVERFLGVPYVWGGTRDDGVDCSGVVQRSAWRASHVWLPRHSTALLRVGARVAPSSLSRGDVERGDVLVLRRNSRVSDPGHHHIAVVASPEEAIHASRDQWRVVREPLSAMRERYEVLGVRRFGVAKGYASR